ncbi:integrase family protein [Stenotrophomonas maltophilia]|nr:integrase family protein [Stenotrophomonas maltophilia]
MTTAVDAAADKEAAMPPRTEQKYRLTQTQLRELTMERRPVLTAAGRVQLVENTTGKPYRFRDGSPGAPIGFGIYVGPTGAYYEVRVKRDGVTRRLALGSVQELSLSDAHELAGAQRSHIRQTGEDPRERIRATTAGRKALETTVGEALKKYLDTLSKPRAGKKAKPSSIRCVQQAIRRLSLPNVALDKVAIAKLEDAQLIEAWNNVRHNAMEASNLLSEDTKERLKAAGRWWELSRVELVRLGLEGRQIALAESAGLASCELTFNHAARAVEKVIEDERKQEALGVRKAVLTYNPFNALREHKMFRSTLDLEKHYARARVRNPMSDEWLGRVLKALVGRRHMANGNFAVGVDYLLLTLLWGMRRSESAQLRWFDRCTADELSNHIYSWVWLAPRPDALNPVTEVSGSQVFLHDTKSGGDLLLPIGPFAETLVRWRWAETQASTRPARLKRWVFPARIDDGASEHFGEAKSMLANVRLDAGLYDPVKGVNIRLTPHDLRRTLGRVAGKLFHGHMVTQMLGHHPEDDEPRRMAKTTRRYIQQAWPDLRVAMAQCEEAIIGTSPRVRNILKPEGYPARDEQDDPELHVPTIRPGNRRRAHYALDQANPGRTG